MSRSSESSSSGSSYFWDLQGQRLLLTSWQQAHIAMAAASPEPGGSGQAGAAPLGPLIGGVGKDRVSQVRAVHAAGWRLPLLLAQRTQHAPACKCPSAGSDVH